MWRKIWNVYFPNKWVQQTKTKGIQDQAWQGGKGDPLGIIQETEIWSYY